MEGGGFEPPKAEPADLQSAPFGRSGTPPKKIERAIVEKTHHYVNHYQSLKCFDFWPCASPFSKTHPFLRFKWSPQRESNPRPADYKSAALPAELCGQVLTKFTAQKWERDFMQSTA